jgi:hypothetical protein
MDETKRATIYFDADVHRALRLRAAACNRSISDMVNEAVRMTLVEGKPSGGGTGKSRTKPLNHQLGDVRLKVLSMS